MTRVQNKKNLKKVKKKFKDSKKPEIDT